VLKLNWSFKLNFWIEFEFRKHRTIKRDMIGWSKVATSAYLDILSFFPRVKTITKALKSFKKLNPTFTGQLGQSTYVTGRPRMALEGVG
jgi:hypothetical protein